MNKSAVLMVFTAVVAVLACGVGQGADGRLRGDVDCIVVGLRMSQMSRAGQRAAGMLLTAYYLGRVNGDEPRVDVGSLIRTEANNMTPGEFGVNAIRCGKAFAAKGRDLQKIRMELARKASKDLSKK